MTFKPPPLPYDPRTLGKDLDYLSAIMRAAITSDVPTVQQALLHLKTVVELSHAEEVKDLRSKEPTEVHMIESERGWGQKVDEVLHFIRRDDAEAYARAYNAHFNSADTTPDYYIRAEVVGR